MRAALGLALGTALALVVPAGMAAAAGEEVAVEVTEVDGAVVTLHVHPFLTDEELTMLRLVASNADARAIFVPEGAGYAAIAVAPKEGFVRKGQPVPSAAAVAQLPDAATAAAKAIETCMAAKKKRGPDCVVVLEIAAE